MRPISSSTTTTRKRRSPAAVQGQGGVLLDDKKIWRVRCLKAGQVLSKLLDFGRLGGSRILWAIRRGWFCAMDCLAPPCPQHRFQEWFAGVYR